MISRLRESASFWATVGAVVLLAAWEAFVRLRNVRKFVLLPPSEIGSTFLDNPGFYLDNIWVTARHLVVGLAIALVISLAFGALSA